MIDASIPLQVKQFDTQQALSDIARMQQMRDAAQRQRSFADLLPKAAHGDQGAIDSLYAVDPNIAMKMDDRQREATKAHIADLSAAVRWADTPEKWAYVQQHYAQEGIDLSPYQFQDRERGLVALGQIGDYLNNAPKNDQTTLQRNYEFLKGQSPDLADRYLHNQAEGPPMIASNGDGTFTVIPRGYGTAPAPQGGGAPHSRQAP